MTDAAIAIIDPPQPPAPVSKNKRLKIGPKLRRAIEAMVYEGADFAEAARIANTSTRAVRKAFEKAHVLKHLAAQKQVLRAAASSKNILRLCEIRDAANNMPAVQAIKLLEQIPDENASASRGMQPGFVVQIVNVQSAADMPHMHQIDAKPLKEQEDV